MWKVFQAFLILFIKQQIIKLEKGFMKDVLSNFLISSPFSHALLISCGATSEGNKSVYSV